MSSNEFHERGSEEYASEFTTKLEDGLSPEKVIEFLRSCRPEMIDPIYRIGNRRKFEKYVQNDPDAFIKLSSQIMELHPEFVSAFFDGIRGAVGQNQSIDWTSILSLYEQVIKLTNQSKRERRAVLRTIARTIDKGMEKRSIDFALKYQVWKIIKHIVISEDKDSSMEEMYPSEDKDLLIASIYTLDGAAFYSVMTYAIWCKNNIKNDKIFASEVRELISYYLDRKIPASPAIQFVLGHHLQDLYIFNKDWIKPKLDQLFSDANSLSKPTWDGYLYLPTEEVCTYLNKDVFVDLADKYDTHIKELKNPSCNGDNLWKTDRQVIRHLVKAYLFKFDKAKELFNSMILHSDGRVLSYCSWAIGQTLRIQKEAPDKLFDIDAFREVWKNSTLPSKEEICDWFSYSPLDEEETLEFLYNSLEKLDDSTYILFPIEELKPYAKTCPKLTVKCLGQIIEKDRKGWGYYNTACELKDLLRILLDDAETRESATALVYRLLELDYDIYRDLLKYPAAI